MMLHPKQFEKRYNNLMEQFGDIQHNDVPLVSCLQGRLYGYYRQKPQRTIFNVLKDIIKPFFQVISIKFGNSIVERGRIMKRNKESKTSPNIKGRVLFVLESNPHSSCWKTLSAIASEMDDDEYIMITNEERYRLYEQSNIKTTNIFPMGQFVNTNDIRLCGVITYLIGFFKQSYSTGTEFNVHFLSWIISRVVVVLAYVQVFEKIVGQCPKAVINAKEKFPMASAAAHVSNRNGIPTIFVEHSTTKGSGGFTYEYPLVSRYVMVYGRQGKEWYINRGVEDERIFVSGQPRYDAQQNMNMGAKDASEKLKSFRSHRVVTLATQPFGSYAQRNQIVAFEEAINNLQINIKAVIKPHPRDDVETIRDVLSGDDIIEVLEKNIDIRKVLKYSDCLVTYSSTVGLEALAFNVPLVITNFLSVPNSSDYCDEGVAYCSNSVRELSQSIKTAICQNNDRPVLSNKVKKYVNRRIQNHEGGASEYIRSKIHRIAEQHAS